MDTTSLITAWVGTRSRKEIIHDHNVSVPLRFWEGYSDLPGMPLIGQSVTGNSISITRGTLFELAADAREDSTGDSALRLLWHTLAWGTGASNRNNRRRIMSVQADLPNAKRVLNEAAALAQSDPLKAFEILHPRNKNAIPYLGPNFTTKFLYAAGGGAPAHPAAIVDSRVLATLYAVTGDDWFQMKPRAFKYGVKRYSAVLEEMTRMSEAASSPNRPIALDEVERWAFEFAADPGKQSQS